MNRKSIRYRITVLATAVVALVLVLAGISLVLVQRALLTDNIDQALLQRANDIVALLETNQSLEELPQGTIEAFAQLVDEEGNVILTTPNLRDSPALPIAIRPNEMIELKTVEGLEIDDDTYRVLIRKIDELGVLRVGTTYEVVSESTAALTSSLATGIPIVVTALAVVVWWLVGRTLQPVEAIRSEVAAIDSSELARRVPGTGSGDEIDRLAGTMNAMLKRVENAVTRQRRFVADASHELRIPLTRIRSALEVELASKNPSFEQLAEDVRHEVIGLQHMVEDMLYMARADEGTLPDEVKQLDLDDLVLREVRGLRSRPEVKIDMYRVSAAQVNGDARQLSRAVRNLVANAERHATSRVELSLAEKNGDAVLTVADDGPGIPADQAEFIFQRFTRLDESRTADSGGAGLGLAIAREIVESHAGTLQLISNGAPGASFEMRIPLAD